MVRLITVHGTFAGDDKSTGDKWWQKRSPFLTELQSFIAEPLDVRPFHWSGENSEIERRRSGARLARVIDDSPEPPVIIGHSHGGSAAIQALSLLFLKRGERSADQIKGFVSIGTPMLLFRQNKNPFSRFDLTGRLMLLFALGLLAMKAGEIAAGAYVGQQIEGFGSGLVEFVRSIQFALATLILMVLYAYSHRANRRADLFRQNKLYRIFSERYLALNHSQDEAINGLKKAFVVEPKLVQRSTVFVTLFSSLSFILVSLFFVMQLLRVSSVPLPPVLGDSFAILEEAIFVPIEILLLQWIPEDLATSDLFLQVLAGFTIIPVAAFLSLAAILSFVAALLLTPSLSAFVTQQLKSQSFGDDGYGETIKAVVPGLDFRADEVGTLPAPVEGQMIKASGSDAAAAITRLRELLSSGELLKAEGADLIAQSMKFEKSELLHNAYFHSSLFIRYLAEQLVSEFGLTPSDKLRAKGGETMHLSAAGRDKSIRL